MATPRHHHDLHSSTSTSSVSGSVIVSPADWVFQSQSGYGSPSAAVHTTAGTTTGCEWDACSASQTCVRLSVFAYVMRWLTLWSRLATPIPMSMIDQARSPLVPTPSIGRPTSPPLPPPSNGAGQPDPDAPAQLENGQTIYDVDIDSLEDKPWRRPGSNNADYFNYGFDEAMWRVYVRRQKEFKDQREREKQNPFTVRVRPVDRGCAQHTKLDPPPETVVCKVFCRRSVERVATGSKGPADDDYHELVWSDGWYVWIRTDGDAWYGDAWDGDAGDGDAGDARHVCYDERDERRRWWWWR
jgi:hypothetical protein